MRPLLALAAALLASTSAQADTIYTGSFSGEQETVDTGSPGSGNGRVILSDDGRSLTVQFDFANLLAPTLDSHIHCCAPLGDDPAVNNGPVAIGFTPAGFPIGVTSGSFAASFDLTLDTTYTAGFLAASGGTAAGARARLIGGLDAGLAYLNIHSQLFPPGEVRAQLNESVPEPAALGLVGVGLAALGWRQRRRRTPPV